MKMLKRLVVLIIAVLALEGGGFARFLTEKTEISFKVGESVLNINGENVTVETPYVVGEGVTLVPVRVITEAFGAKVDWDGGERKVTLTTDENKIELWIGRIDAKMNGETLTLLSAPEISNNVTMVPLRFISEGFGAEVSYDSKTKQITVLLEKGPVVKNGFKRFDDGVVSLPVPEDYDAVKSQEMQYKFSKMLEYNYSDFDTVWSYAFSVPLISDVETVLQNDRDTQSEAIKSKNYVVSKVEKNLLGDIESFSYSISYKQNVNTFLRIRKTLYNYGQYSYFTVSVYDTYYNTGKPVKEDGRLTKIDYSSYSITVPEEFSLCKNISTIPFDISGKANPEISVSVHGKGEDFDAKAYLEDKENSYKYIVDQRNVGVSRVKEYTFDDKTYYGLVLSYINGGKMYYILSEYDNCIAVFEFQQDNFEFAQDIISGFGLCESGEIMSQLKTLDDNSVVKVQTDEFDFELPSCFEKSISEDRGYICGTDEKTNAYLCIYNEFDTVANERYESDVHYDAPIPGFSFQSQSFWVTKYTSINYKKTFSATALETIELYENDGWEIESQKRRQESKKLDEDYVEVHIEEIVFRKSVANNVTAYQKLLFVFADTDKYEISDSDERIKALKELLEKGDFNREYDMPDQKVHAFVFTYTNSSNEKYINELCENIIDSIKLK